FAKTARIVPDIECIHVATGGLFMKAYYPTAREVGINIPGHLRPNRFEAGFLHALQGHHLRKAEHLRLSFREGFRAAKLYLRWLRKTQGIIEFPMKARVKFKTIVHCEAPKKYRTA
ncbi:MAG: hypothetical protein OEX19_17410, partial [Gammaproteobacteria bacterium]|nr:hypothetical protein [Gammaproteobacteria bacterium]